MRIATSTLYGQQTNAIDNLQAQYQDQGMQLSTGRSLNAPSDDPTNIGQDLGVRATIRVENQQTINLQAATAQLTSTDSALANLTTLLQSTRVVAVSGATDLVSKTDRQDMAGQVDQYLQQTIAIANTQYGAAYVFAGSAQLSTPPITTTGSPVSSVSFAGNEQTGAPMLFNGQSFALSPTLQQSFNYSATNGSPSVFTTLITLRDTLSQGLVTDQSAAAINHVGTLIYGAGSPTPTTLGTTPSPFAVAPVADSSGNYSISINSTDANGNTHVSAYTFTAATAVDDGTPASIVGAINAKNTGANATGLTASFNAQTQRLVLTNTGGGSFSVSDEPPASSTTTSNFTTLFKLQGSATLPQTISTQLGDIDNALDVTLNARSVVGSRINALAQINTQVTTDINNSTTVQSGLEDTNVAKVTTQFTATQVALTASYSTTSRLEAKSLFDYL